jgi:phosphohistidine phosphatase
MPKTLYLVRHAKSDWNNGETDFDRTLNPRGQCDAPEMGLRLKARDVHPDIIVCSPATRAFQTLELLALPAGTVEYNENIYEASAIALLDIVQSLEDTADSAMLVGHNPAMSWLAGHLTGVRIDNMPTCSVATIRLTSNHWKKAGQDPAELLDFDHPKKESNL